LGCIAAAPDPVSDYWWANHSIELKVTIKRLPRPHH